MFNTDLILERFSLLDEIEIVDMFMEKHNDLFLEMKSKKEYRERSFKKKYNYDPKSKTIEVDGDKIPVKFDQTKKDERTGKQERIGTAVSYNKKTKELNYLNIDRNDLYKSKNTKRRDAMIQHEIGHIKYQTSNGKYNPGHKNIEKKRKELTNYMSQLLNREQQLFLKNMDKYQDLSESELDKIERKIVRNIEREAIKHFGYSIDDLNEMKDDLDDERMNFLLKFRKYSRTHLASHANSREFEADRYAANKTSKSDLKKSLQEGNKHIREDIKKDVVQKELNELNSLYIQKQKNPDLSKNDVDKYKQRFFKSDNVLYTHNEYKNILTKMYKKHNKSANVDMKMRSRALNDKNIAIKSKALYN